MQHVFAEAIAAGFRTIICGSSVDSCCCDAHSIAVEILIEGHSLTSFSDFISSYGFYQVATGQSGSRKTHFLGYCERCEALVQLNVSTELVAGKLSGNYLVLNRTRALFEATEQAGQVPASMAVEIVSCVCAASLLYEYQGRARRRLLTQAKACVEKCESDLLQSVSMALVGEEATRYIIKLLDISVNWEIDVLLLELKRELRHADDVSFNTNRSLQLPLQVCNTARLRLASATGEIRRAPIVVVAQAAGDTGSVERASEIISTKLDCRVLEFYGDSRVKPDRDQLLVAESNRHKNLRVVVNAIVAACRNYWQFRRARSLAKRGVVVILRGYPVVGFPAGNSVRKLNQLKNSTNTLWRFISVIERKICQKIPSAEVDCLIVVSSTKSIARTAINNGDYEVRRRSWKIKDVSVNAVRKTTIDASVPSFDIPGRIVGAILAVAADR